MPNYADSIKRTLEEKFGDRPSILDFIPRPLHSAIRANVSTADLLPYFQDAANSLHGSKGDTMGELLIPPGRYSLSGPVRLHSYTRLVGSGELYLLDGSDTDVVTNYDQETGNVRIEVHGITVNGNGTNNDGIASRSLYFKNVVGGVISGVTIPSSRNHNIWLNDGCKDWKLLNNICENPQFGSCILVGNTPGEAVVEKVDIIGNMCRGSVIANGIFTCGAATEDGYGTRWITIVGNQCIDNADVAIEIGMGSWDVTCSANVCLTYNTGSVGVMARGTKHVTITGNNCSHRTETDIARGYFVWNGTGPYPNLESCILSGNSAYNYPTYGFEIDSGSDISVFGNKSIGSGIGKYLVGPTVTNLQWAGNDDNRYQTILPYKDFESDNKEDIGQDTERFRDLYLERSISLKVDGAPHAATGAIRAPNDKAIICARNQGNDGDVEIVRLTDGDLIGFGADIATGLRIVNQGGASAQALQVVTETDGSHGLSVANSEHAFGMAVRADAGDALVFRDITDGVDRWKVATTGAQTLYGPLTVDRQSGAGPDSLRVRTDADATVGVTLEKSGAQWGLAIRADEANAAVLRYITGNLDVFKMTAAGRMFLAQYGGNNRVLIYDGTSKEVSPGRVDIGNANHVEGAGLAAGAILAWDGEKVVSGAAGDSGDTGKFLRKTSGGSDWEKVDLTDATAVIVPGMVAAEDTVVTTNGLSLTATSYTSLAGALFELMKASMLSYIQGEIQIGMSQVTGLEDALDDKSDSGHTHGVSIALVGTPEEHSHTTDPA